MAERKPSTRRKSPAAEAADAVKDIPVEALEAPPEPEPLNAVVVVKKPTADGGIQTEIAMYGDVQATEVQTLLELGVKGWRERIGLAS